VAFKVGLTGGIASGKTTVSDYFTQLQVPVIDADIIAHELVQPGQPTLVLLENAFGAKIINPEGHLNRAQLRKQVFDNPKERQLLEAILHPRIREMMRTQVQQITYPYCILSIPLLLETQQMNEVDRILVVDCEENLQRYRLKIRNGFSEIEIDKMLAAQARRQDRLAIADDIIDNNGNQAHLIQQVTELHKNYLQLSSH